MFSLKDAYKEITLDEIYSKVSELELWRYYCRNFEEINKPFCSELYNDKNPGCRIFYSNNKLLYKDFGDKGIVYTIIDYIKAKYNITFRECLKIIANDFNIHKSNVILNNEKNLKFEEKFIIKPKTIIEIVPQPFNIHDYNYWNKYYITLHQLSENQIYSCKYVYLTTGKGTFKYEWSKNNPIYAWREYDLELNFIGWKVYMPKSNSKWLNNASNDVIQGIKYLKYNSNLLILTKSRKDVLVLNKLGYEAISLASENVVLKQEVFDYFNSKYDKIISLYDNDEAGIMYALKLKEQYNIDYIFLDEYKDISDYIEDKGLNYTKEMINVRINELQ